MLCLGLNTAGPACDLCLLEDDLVLGTAHEAMLRGQDQRLPGLLQTLLNETGKTLADLDRIGVVTGPGSFTGVRVGLAFARGLALGTGIACIGVTSLEAALPDGQQGSAIVLFPAQRRQPDITFWMQRFRSGAALTPPEEIRLDALQDLLIAKPHMLYGEAEALKQARPELIIRAAQASAERVARFAARSVPDQHPPNATYVRAPDAALPTKP